MERNRKSGMSLLDVAVAVAILFVVAVATVVTFSSTQADASRRAADREVADLDFVPRIPQLAR